MIEADFASWSTIAWHFSFLSASSSRSRPRSRSSLEAREMVKLVARWLKWKILVPFKLRNCRCVPRTSLGNWHACSSWLATAIKLISIICITVGPALYGQGQDVQLRRMKKVLQNDLYLIPVKRRGRKYEYRNSISYSNTPLTSLHAPGIHTVGKWVSAFYGKL